MLATIIHGERDIRIEERPQPVVIDAGDAVVRVVAACVCGSDLWPYRGVRETSAPHPIGHEFIGVVDSVGSSVNTLAVGDFVISPFTSSDGTCSSCQHGMQATCDHLSFFGGNDTNGQPLPGAQGEYVRVPYADGTLVVVPAPSTSGSSPRFSPSPTSCRPGTMPRSARVSALTRRSSWSATALSGSPECSPRTASVRPASSR